MYAHVHTNYHKVGFLNKSLTLNIKPSNKLSGIQADLHELVK